MESIEAYDFGTLLRQLRKKKRLSQTELAAKLWLRISWDDRCMGTEFRGPTGCVAKTDGEHEEHHFL